VFLKVTSNGISNPVSPYNSSKHLQRPKKPRSPPILDSQCAALKVPYTGNAAGHNSTTDLSGLKVGPYPQRLGCHSKGIGAMAGCVLAALFGMLSVVWYMLGGGVDEGEVEKEEREKIEKKERKKGEAKDEKAL
jgi:iron transport multicopper oxidase